MFLSRVYAPADFLNRFVIGFYLFFCVCVFFVLYLVYDSVINK